MPGPIPQTTTSAPRLGRVDAARGDGHALDVAVETRRDGDRRLEELARLQGPDRVRQGDRKRTAALLDVDDPTAGERRADRRELAVEARADHRQAREALGVLRAILLHEPGRELSRRVRQGHHVRPFGHGQLQAPGQVGVEDVEAARAELELRRLHVDEHDVADLHLARQPRVGEARPPVDLEPDEAVVALADRADRAPAEPERHQPSNGCCAASTIPTVTSTIRSRSSTAMRSSGVWMSTIPFARFTQGRPRSLKTFASAAPPERTSRGS